MWGIWRWLLLAAALTAKTTMALPVPDEILDTSTNRILGSSVVTSVSVVMGHEDGNADSESDRREVTDDLPASTVDMLRPDGFQFYTVDEKGQLITRQMTDSEIQSIIAAAGGPLPIGAFDNQKMGENATGETKVAEVVQNVQNVLKEELNKPPVAMGTVPTIPGHASAEWSSILPSILGGDTDTETAPVSLAEIEKPAVPVPVAGIQDIEKDERIPETPPTSTEPAALLLIPEEMKPTKDNVESIAEETSAENVRKPVKEVAKKPPVKEMEKPTQEEIEDEENERPMILVPVITTEDVHLTAKDPILSQDKPVYQILDTISADDVKKNQDSQSSTERIKEEEKVGESVGDSKPAIEADQEEEKPAVIGDTMEMEIAQSNVALKPEKESEEPMNISAIKDAEKTELVSEVEKQKTPVTVQKTPSIILEAPAVAAEIPVEISLAENNEKPATDDRKKKPAAEEEEKKDEISTAVETLTSEKETLTESMEEKVSEIVNMFPESINSIVEELISESGIKASEKLKGEVEEEISKPVVSENTKVKEEGETKVTESSNRVEKPEKLEEVEKTESAIPPKKSEILPQIISRPIEASTDIKTTEKIESKPVSATNVVPEAQISIEKIDEQLETTTTKIKLAESQEEVTENFIPVILTAPAPAIPQPDLQAPTVSTSAAEENTEGPKTAEEKEKPVVSEEKKPETLLTELADSVSSMISQISEVMPSMVPIPHESTEINQSMNDQSVKKVEDKVKPESTTTMNDPPKSTEKIQNGETLAEIPVNKVEEILETSKPHKTESEVETAIPEKAETTETVSETTKISQSVPAEAAVKPIKTQEPEVPVKVELPAAVSIAETGSAETIGKIDTPKPEVLPEDTEIEKIETVATNSETKPEKPEVDLKDENVVLKTAEDTEPQKAPEEQTKIEIKPESSGSPASEAPIVRIDITEAKPTDVSLPAIITDANDGSTESPVVRIQMTNPVATIDQMIDAAPDQTPPIAVEELSLPDDKIESLTAQNIGSSLIAGPQQENPTGMKVSEESSSPIATANQPILENAIPIASGDPETKTSSTGEKLSSESIAVSKPDVETQETKIPEIVIPQAIAEPKPTPEADKEENLKSPALETEASKVTEEFNEPKPTVEKETETLLASEKVEETETASENSESEILVDPVVTVNEKIESSEKSEESVASDAEKIIELKNISTVIYSKDKETAMSTEASVKVPSEVVVSTTVDVVTEKNATEKSPESVDDDSTKTTPPVDEEEKKTDSVSEDSTAIKTPAIFEKTESKPETIEADNTATKIKAELSTSAIAVQPEAEKISPVVAVSTETSLSGEKDLPKTESGTKTKDSLSSSQAESQDVVKVQSEETTEKEMQTSVVKNGEIPASVVSSDDKGPQDSVRIPVPQINPPLSDENPAKEVPSDLSIAEDNIKEASNATEAKLEESTKPVAPVVRIDISPEKNESKTSIALDTSSIKPEKMSENDEKLAAIVTKKPMNEEKEPEKSEVLSSPETILDASESPSVAPAKTESNLNKQEIKKEVEKKPEESLIETAENDVKKTIVASELPLENAASTASSKETSNAVKPVEKMDESIPAKTQEIRIQVNDTAVLVTKHPISQEAIKVSENQPDKKPELGEAQASAIDKIETPSETLEPAKESNTDKLEGTKKEDLENKPQTQNSGKDDEVRKTSAQDASSVIIKKKPTIDPYVKLGETQSDSGVKKMPIKNKDNEGGKLNGEKWTLIPQSESYPVVKLKTQPQLTTTAAASADKNEEEPQRVSVPLDAHQSAVNLAESTRNLDKDIESFASLCNELAFSFWTATNKGLSTARSLALSPFGMTSMLAMVFLGARGPTSGQMNDILKLDDVVTFNPHLVFQNVSDSVNLARGQGIANAAFVRELFADRSKAGRLLPFYKERAQQFYDGHVEEVNFATISDLVRRRTNLLIRRQTGGRIRDFVKGNVMPLRSPLAALTANVFQTDCTPASSEGRDGEMYFAVLPAVRQRKLVPVPATVWKSGVLAGYEPGLDATVISLGGVDSLVSTIFLLPGQQGLAALGESLDHLERRLVQDAFAQGVWERLLKTLIPRPGLEVQVPKFSHRSIINATAALKRMGLDELFSKHADLKGINGVGNDLHLADMIQINLFSTCGDEAITGGRHHVEIYPASPLRESRSYKIVDAAIHEAKEEKEEKNKEKNDPRSRRSVDVKEFVEQSRDAKRSVSSSAEEEFIADERSERSSFGSKEKSRESIGKQSGNSLLKLDRPFLYFVRHNPTGMILHMGRFNPRLMP